ncbi:MAG: hypothetical protein IJ614_08680 [Prevotella sp.]|nr:hypothetical protein [Prevotella sp.]MBR1506166.1 hypothetical protein [Prevotella sp.]
MKTIKLFTTLLFMALSVSLTAQAQSTKQQKLQQTRAELKEKASKAAKDEGKRLKKEGWEVSPGGLPMERQLDRTYMFIEDYDDDMNPAYIMGEGRSIAENFSAAHIQATELARVDIAGKMVGSEATALIDNLVANKQLAQDQAASITTTMMENKTIYSQKLGRVQEALVLNRTLKNKNKEVMVRLVTKADAVREIAKEAIRQELEKKGVQMSEELKQYLK